MHDHARNLEASFVSNKYKARASRSLCNDRETNNIMQCHRKQCLRNCQHGALRSAQTCFCTSKLMIATAGVTSCLTEDPTPTSRLHAHNKRNKSLQSVSSHERNVKSRTAKRLTLIVSVKLGSEMINVTIDCRPLPHSPISVT